MSSDLSMKIAARHDQFMAMPQIQNCRNAVRPDYQECFDVIIRLAMAEGYGIGLRDAEESAMRTIDSVFSKFKQGDK